MSCALLLSVAGSGSLSGWLPPLQAGVTSQAQQQDPLRPITVRGCVSPTSRDDVFLLGVRGSFPDPDRGIETGAPVPEGGGIGPAPRTRPETIPPPRASAGSELPDGRYQTPTIRNLTYRLADLERRTAQTLKELIGKEVEVRGRIPVEGYPTGDLEGGGTTVGPGTGHPFIPMRVDAVKLIADVCVPDSSNAAPR